MYMYKDENGNIIKKGLLEKDKIPKKVNRKIYKLKEIMPPVINNNPGASKQVITYYPTQTIIS